MSFFSFLGLTLCCKLFHVSWAGFKRSGRGEKRRQLHRHVLLTSGLLVNPCWSLSREGPYRAADSSSVCLGHVEITGGKRVKRGKSWACWELLKFQENRVSTIWTNVIQSDWFHFKNVWMGLHVDMKRLSLRDVKMLLWHAPDGDFNCGWFWGFWSRWMDRQTERGSDLKHQQVSCRPCFSLAIERTDPLTLLLLTVFINTKTQWFCQLYFETYFIMKEFLSCVHFDMNDKSLCCLNAFQFVLQFFSIDLVRFSQHNWTFHNS